MMGDVIKNYIIVGFIVLAISAVGFYFAFQSSIPLDQYKQPEQKIAVGENAKPIPPKPGFKIEITGKNKVTVYWENLFSSTIKLDIFRKKTNSNKWTLWQTIVIYGGNMNGSAQFAANNPSGYDYYAQGYSSSGGTVWASPESKALPLETPVPVINSSPSTSPTVAPSSPSPSSSMPSSTSTSSASSSALSQSSSSQPVYYSPNQQSSNSSPSITKSFWVQYVNKNIEISWQNLPPQSDEAKIYRSASSNGGWTLLLDQKNIDVVGPAHIRLVDSTLGGSYYKLDVYSLGAFVATYDPEFLPALVE